MDAALKTLGAQFFSGFALGEGLCVTVSCRSRSATREGLPTLPILVENSRAGGSRFISTTKYFIRGKCLKTDTPSPLPKDHRPPLHPPLVFPGKPGAPGGTSRALLHS